MNTIQRSLDLMSLNINRMKITSNNELLFKTNISFEWKSSFGLFCTEIAFNIKHNNNNKLL